jgi:hypothetical protein
MEVLQKLLASRRFWTALLALVLVVLTVGFGVSPVITTAISTFALALITAFTVDDAVTTHANAQIAITKLNLEEARTYKA